MNTTPIIESFNVDEEFMYGEVYNFIKGYATGMCLTQTLKALPLARKFHNGQYRKGTIMVDGKEWRLPYILHCLKVCSTLISLNLPMSNEELDILFASALLHDSIEDAETYFPDGGIELVTEYGFSEKVYETVSLVSKTPGYTDEQLNTYFNNIKRNKFALLVKLADRSHNVEDLYNMKTEKIHKYVRETRMWIYSLSTYGKANYPELSNGLTILKSKIVSLTEATETLVEMYGAIINEKDKEIEELKKQLS